MPNGLARGRDGRIYVPNTVSRPPKIDVFSLTEDHLLHPIESILTPYPIDNLAVDKHGDIFAGAIPQVYKWTQSSKDPHHVKVPGAVLKISREGKGHERTGRNKEMKRSEGEYSVEKVLEDDGSVFPGTTTAVHDAETGRMFLGGAMSPFITICETR
jgi:arylesterase/paraoxonase